MYPHINSPMNYYSTQPQQQMNIQESQPLMSQPLMSQQPQQQYFPNLQQNVQTQPKVFIQPVQPMQQTIYIPPTQQPEIVTQRALKFEEPVIQSITPMGSVNPKTGRLTFTSSNFWLRLFLIIFVIYATAIAIVFFTVSTQFKRGMWPIGFIFLIPSLLAILITFLSRVHTVEFDDSYKRLILRSAFRCFVCCCPCFSSEKYISYNSIEDIHVEFYNGYKSQLVLMTTEQEKIKLLSGRFGGSGYTIFQNQACAQEMRKHLTQTTRV